MQLIENNSFLKLGLIAMVLLLLTFACKDDSEENLPSRAEILRDNLSSTAPNEKWVIESFKAEFLETWRESGDTIEAVDDFDYCLAVPFDEFACGPDNKGDYMVFESLDSLKIHSGRNQICSGISVDKNQVLEKAIWRIVEADTLADVALGISEFTPIELNFFITPLDPAGRFADFATACFNPASQPYLFVLTSPDPSASNLTFEFVLSCELWNQLFNSPGTFDLVVQLTLSKTLDE